MVRVFLVFLGALVFASNPLAFAQYTNQNGYNNEDFRTNGESRFLEEYLNPSSKIIFDVGANMGEWSLIAKKQAPNAVIHAFEPHPQIFDLLKYRAQEKQITCNQLALSNTKKEIDLWVWGGTTDLIKSGLNGLYYRPLLKNAFNQEPTKIKVTTQTLDQYCKEHKVSHIDLLKIDTEGSELDILLGSQNMISSRSIDCIQFEYGGCYVDSQAKLESIFHMLVKNNYEIFRILPNKLLPIPNWDPTLENYQYSNYAGILKK